MQQLVYTAGEYAVGENEAGEYAVGEMKQVSMLWVKMKHVSEQVLFTMQQDARTQIFSGL